MPLGTMHIMATRTRFSCSKVGCCTLLKTKPTSASCITKAWTICGECSDCKLTVTLGCFCLNCASARGKMSWLSASTLAMRNSSVARPLRRLSARRCTSSNCANSFSMCGSRAKASLVGVSRPLLRWNNAKPSCSSACCKVRLTAGCEMLIKRAAALTLPVCMTALKTSIWRSRIVFYPCSVRRVLRLHARQALALPVHIIAAIHAVEYSRQHKQQV